MTKNIIFKLFFFYFCWINSTAQNFEWAKSIGSTGTEQSYAIETDSNGNVYTVGGFSGIVDFDPGLGTTFANSINGSTFITKFDSSGNFIWVKTLNVSEDTGFGTGNLIAIDSVNNIYLTGEFSGTIDFDPSGNVYNATCIGNKNGFVLKLNSSGDFIWVKTFTGSSSSDISFGKAIALDPLGNIFIALPFQGIIDFDPGINVFNLNSSSTSHKFCIIKLDNFGNFIWASQIIEQAGYMSVNSITSDSFGNIIMTGLFNDVVDFDPGPNTYNLSSQYHNEVFISKLDSSGNFIWAKRLGGTFSQGAGPYNSGECVKTDGFNNIYVSGYFKGNIDFDPGPSTYFLNQITGNYTTSGFILKLDLSGNFIWARNTIIQTAGNNKIALDVNNNIYYINSLSGTQDADPSAGVFNVSSAGGTDVLVGKLTSDGAFVYAKTMGGTGNESPVAIAISSKGSVLTNGSFQNAADFDPDSLLYNLTSAGETDVFVSSLSSGQALTTGLVPAQLCPGAQVDVSYSLTQGFTANTGNIFTAQLSDANGSFVTPIAIGTLTSTATSGSISCIIPTSTGSGSNYLIRVISNNPSVIGSVTNTITIVNSIIPTVIISASQSTICSTPTTVKYNATNSNGGASPSYQWKKNGSNVGTNSPTYTDASAQAGDQVSVVMTISAACSTAIVTSNVIQLNTAPTITPSIVLKASQNTICNSTDNVLYTATIQNGGTNPIYQWYKNGIQLGSNSVTYYDSAPSDGDQVYVTLTSNASCTSAEVVNSNTIQLAFTTGTIDSSVSISISQITICGTTKQVIYTATALNPGTSPIYTWQKNGTFVNVTGPIYVDNNPANHDNVKVSLISNQNCATEISVSSNKIYLNLDPTITVSASQTTICATTTQVVYTANGVVGYGAAYYQWVKNGINVGTNSPTYLDINPATNDQVYVNYYSCSSDTAISSNKITLNYTSTSVSPSVSITASQTTICAGTTQVIYTATGVNGGNSPIYKWYKNGILKANGITFVDTTPVANDQVYAVLTSNASCINPVTVNSNSIQLNYTSTSVSPNVTIIASQTTICAATTNVVYTATPINGGLNPFYQWYKNGALINGNNNIFIDNAPADNDQVYVILLSDASCLSSNSTQSNLIQLSYTASSNSIPQVAIVLNPGVYCNQTVFSFTTNSVNQGSNPVYIWKKNNIIVGGNSSYYLDSNIVVGDVISVQLISNANCISIPNAADSLTISNSITWTGVVDSDWHKSCNWSPTVVPQCCSSVIIPFTSNQPFISGVAACKDISIYTTDGAKVTIATGANLQIETCPTAITIVDCGTIPIISTNTVNNITPTSASSGGTIIFSGNSTIIARGICWSLNSNPTTNDNKTIQAGSVGNFLSNMTNLSINTTYHIRAYVSTNESTYYGQDIIFTTLPITIGQLYQGGIVAYVYQQGDTGYVPGQFHGLISYTSDLSFTAPWHCGWSLLNTSTGIGSGLSNSSLIVSQYDQETNNAARLCIDLVFNGYSDWFLPSLDELNLLFINKYQIGGFSNGAYWSSSNAGKMSAWSIDFNSGAQNYQAHCDYINVRPIRYF